MCTKLRETEKQDTKLQSTVLNLKHDPMKGRFKLLHIAPDPTVRSRDNCGC